MRAFASATSVSTWSSSSAISKATRPKPGVEQDLAEGRRNGVTGTPTFFIDGVRYDGAWDFHSMLEALELPVASRLQRSARAFANLPASGGLVLLLAAAAALVCTNTPLAPMYRDFIGSAFGIGPPGSLLSMSVGAWFSEGLLAIFFLLVGLEIRREMTAGELSDPRAAILPVLAAVGGVLAPAAIYLTLNSGPAARGWSVPTATDVAFTLGILALLGPRVPPSLRVFVAALAVADDVLSVLTLAIFYPRDFSTVMAASWAASPSPRFSRSTAGASMRPGRISSSRRCFGSRCTRRASTARSPASCLPPSCRRDPRRRWRRCWRRPRPRSRRSRMPKSEARRSGADVVTHRAGAGVGLGEPQSLRGERAALVAGGPHRARRLARGAPTSSCRSSRFRRRASASTSTFRRRTRGGYSSASFSGLVIGKPLGISLASLLAIKVAPCARAGRRDGAELSSARRAFAASATRSRCSWPTRHFPMRLRGARQDRRADRLGARRGAGRERSSPPIRRRLQEPRRLRCKPRKRRPAAQTPASTRQRLRRPSTKISSRRRTVACQLGLLYML